MAHFNINYAPSGVVGVSGGADGSEDCVYNTDITGETQVENSPTSSFENNLQTHKNPNATSVIVASSGVSSSESPTRNVISNGIQTAQTCSSKIPNISVSCETITQPSASIIFTNSSEHSKNNRMIESYVGEENIIYRNDDLYAMFEEQKKNSQEFIEKFHYLQESINCFVQLMNKLICQHNDLNAQMAIANDFNKNYTQVREEANASNDTARPNQPQQYFDPQIYSNQNKQQLVVVDDNRQHNFVPNNVAHFHHHHQHQYNDFNSQNQITKYGMYLQLNFS